MSVTVSQAIATVRSLIEDNVPVHPNTGNPLPVSWQGEDPVQLPNDPSPFIYVVFETTKSAVIENGRGRGGNRHRTPAAATILIFVPTGWGLQYGTDYAEGFATVFRPYNSNGVICDAVTVYPGGPGSEIAVPGMDNEAGNYFWSGCEVEFYFDLIG
jgi:hypothetical protein